jgi:dTDP-4-amino-4,6-dideoxygalactose transaminase
MIIYKRRQNYLTLLRHLLGLEGIEILFKNLEAGICPLFFPIIIEDRGTIEQYLQQNRIETFVFGRKLHPSLEIKDYPESQFLSSHVLGLPVHQDLSEEDMDRMTKAIDTWRKLAPIR